MQQLSTRQQIVYDNPVYKIIYCTRQPLIGTASLAQWLRRPPRKRKVRSLNPACDGIFFGSSFTSDLKIGSPGAWRYRVSAGTCRPGVSIL